MKSVAERQQEKLLANNPPWLQEEDGQAVDDEWFYQSIKRYDHLCMYSLSNFADAIALSPCGGFLAIAGPVRRPSRPHSRKRPRRDNGAHDDGSNASEDDSDHSTGQAGGSAGDHEGSSQQMENLSEDAEVVDDVKEIMVLALPQKLLVSGNAAQEGLSARRDFSLVAGYRTGTAEKDCGDVCQVSFGRTSDVVIVLFRRLLNVYFKSDGCDLLTLKTGWPVQSVSPFMCVNQQTGVVYFGNQRGVESHYLPTKSSSAEETNASMRTKWNLKEQLAHVVLSGNDGMVGLTPCGQRLTPKDCQGEDTDESREERQRRCHGVAAAALCGADPELTAVISRSTLSVLRLEVVVANLTDKEFASTSGLWWWGANRLVTACGNVLNVIDFSVDGKSGTAALKSTFRHDGHAAAVTAWAPHPTVARLCFSADAKGALHAWQFSDRVLAVSDL